MSSTPKIKNWWHQFPSALKAIAKARLLAAIGAGGVIYLTPLVFNQAQLTATEIGSGVAAAAFAGTFARLITGRLLDRGLNSLFILRAYALTAIFADFWLINANNYLFYIFGEILIGIAAGMYWPAIELAVPNSCENFPSSKGFALVRSSDALGTSIGAIIGSIGASQGVTKIIYLVNTICMLLLYISLKKRDFKNDYQRSVNYKKKILKDNKSKLDQLSWLPSLTPILLISLISTSIFSLLQSVLPLDLVKGGIYRPSLSDGWSGALIAYQLGLLVIFQWPIGRWLSNYNPKFGLSISLYNFGFGCLLLGLSSIWDLGIYLAFLAQIPISIGLAAFLPTATEAVIKIPPIEYRGISMAIFSQCFAISGLTIPIVAGKVLDEQGHAMFIWLAISFLCIVSLPLIKRIRA